MLQYAENLSIGVWLISDNDSGDDDGGSCGGDDGDDDDGSGNDGWIRCRQLLISSASSVSHCNN